MSKNQASHYPVVTNLKKSQNFPNLILFLSQKSQAKQPLKLFFIDNFFTGFFKNLIESHKNVSKTGKMYLIKKKMKNQRISFRF